MTAPTIAPATSAPSYDTGRRNSTGAGARPSRVRRIPMPPQGPPYDDERLEPAGRAELAVPLPFPAPAAAVPRLRLVPVPERATAPSGLAPPAAWSARFVRVLLEALAGLRPVAQLGVWAESEVCRVVARRTAAANRCQDRRRTIGSLRSLHVSSPATGVAEVCAVVQFGDRVRALALRIEAGEAQWRCTDLRLG